MQIISGKFKHASFDSPNDEKTHPMGNREKLALFNMLNGEIEGKKVLDVFAGTGALGLEALSLGAKYVIFVEKSPKIAKILKNNAEKVLKTEKDRAKIIISDVKNLKFEEKFDLIFADPPYDLYSDELVSPLVPFLEKSALLVLSMPKTSGTPVLEGLEMISRREYAAAAIILFRKTE